LHVQSRVVLQNLKGLSFLEGTTLFPVYQPALVCAVEVKRSSASRHLSSTGDGECYFAD